MKIIPTAALKLHPEPVTAPVAAPAVERPLTIQLPDDAHQEIAELRKCFEGFVDEAMGQIRGLQTRLDRTPAEPASGSRETTEAIVKLALDLDQFKNTVNAVTQRLDRLAEDVAALKKPSASSPLPKGPDAVKPKDPTPPAAPMVKKDTPPAAVERKVAFFTKVWDYLNHVAFEDPLRKND